MRNFNIFFSFIFFLINFIKCDDKTRNILNYDKNEKSKDKIDNPTFQDFEKLKKKLNENNLEELQKVLDEMKNELNLYKNKNNIKEKDQKENMNEEIDNLEEEDYFMHPNNLNDMLTFYTYLQKILNSNIETSEKKMVKAFLRKSIKNIKEKEKLTSIEDVLKNTEGHEEMLEKLANVVKIDKEKLKDEEIRKHLNQILIGILKFIDYTNNSNILNDLLSEIDLNNLNLEEGIDKKKLHESINNSKTHLEMLQKASNFMGFNISEEKLKELTTKNKWYQNYLDHLLNYVTDEEL